MLCREKTETWFVDKLQNTFHFLTYSSIYISIEGGAMAYISCSIQQIRCSFTLFAIMFLVTFSVYNLNMRTDEEEDSINNLDRYSFTKKYEKTLYFSALIAYFFSLLFAMSHGSKAMLITSIPLICGILYSGMWIPKESKYRRLKEILGIKNFVVAIAWALPSALLPTQFTSASESLASFVVGVYCFLSTFIGSAICDMRDIEGDAFSGVDTIPVVLGVQKSKTLLAALNLFIGLMVLMISIEYLSPIVTYLLAAGMVYNHLCIFSFDKVVETDFLCDMVVNGKYTILAVILYIGTNMMYRF